ncbi:response regulator [Candidatus Jorgensenbacteria bacterium CG_4_8_14_3_um_filter_38_10]|uniref:Response regulator n=2 Tax=Candidatus Joergenseniibacteriota TaxID=1752739 RepID=A0A2H0NBU8_9BACT|nr:MAG: response regulator [Candidatus Jorgensenbacteria bacterium CG11_big_fil_rev_8_21_14_0_20_38_23]PIV13121.1 MAG: response regulator [Candidatus Jorgensenbacteria bacterium CG03_land_8_20_14_0_80_38_39]PIW97838.1 MAG: response regulator [Candidatus Jorgensenbacteria bacterium CG_4_8_14_3_um_filter_38_10]
MSEQKNILLVEDELLLSNILKSRLEKEGFKVFQARDGEMALKFLRETKPDIILLDIILPKISGFEILEELQKNPELQSAPVAIISNLGQESDIQKGRSLGAINYFVKAQVTIDELVGKIREMLV